MLVHCVIAFYDDTCISQKDCRYSHAPAPVLLSAHDGQSDAVNEIEQRRLTRPLTLQMLNTIEKITENFSELKPKRGNDDRDIGP